MLLQCVVSNSGLDNLAKNILKQMNLPLVAPNAWSFFLSKRCVCAFLIPVTFLEFVIKFEH